MILRIPPVFGRTAALGKISLLEYLENNLFHHKTSSLDNKVVTNYVSGFVLSKLIYLCLEMGITNRILHLASPDFMTRYQLGLLVAKILNKSPELLSSKNQNFPIDDNKAQFIETKYLFTLDVQNAQLLLEKNIPGIEDQLLNYFQLQGLTQEKHHHRVKGSTYI